MIVECPDERERNAFFGRYGAARGLPKDKHGLWGWKHKDGRWLLRIPERFGVLVTAAVLGPCQIVNDRTDAEDEAWTREFMASADYDKINGRR